MYRPNYTVGLQAIQSVYAVDTTQRHPYGFTMDAQDPYWGAGRFMYVRATASIRQFGLVTINSDFDSTNGVWRMNATECPNTANLGSSVAVAMTSATVGQYLWVMREGLTPVNSTASVAADTAFGITAAGQVGAISNGKQILNARVQAAATTTVAKANGVGVSGAFQITVPNTDGWFIGAYLSGTGIGSGAKISSIASNGRDVTLDTANSAAVSGTITATYNNSTIYYNVAQICNPFAQGQVT